MRGPMYGKKQSEETKLKRSKSLRGRKFSPQTIEKLCVRLHSAFFKRRKVK